MSTSTRFNLKFLHTFSKKKDTRESFNLLKFLPKKVSVVIYTEGG